MGKSKILVAKPPEASIIRRCLLQLIKTIDHVVLIDQCQDDVRGCFFI